MIDRAHMRRLFHRMPCHAMENRNGSLQCRNPAFWTVRSAPCRSKSVAIKVPSQPWALQTMTLASLPVDLRFFHSNIHSHKRLLMAILFVVMYARRQESTKGVTPGAVPASAAAATRRRRGGSGDDAEAKGKRSIAGAAPGVDLLSETR